MLLRFSFCFSQMTNEVNARKNLLSFNSTLGKANEHISLRDMTSKGVQNKPVSTTLATKLSEMCPCTGQLSSGPTNQPNISHCHHKLLQSKVWDFSSL